MSVNSSDGCVVVTRESHVGVVRINRPAALNAINGQVATAVEAALDDFEADPGIRAIVLTGTGDRAFCAGTDLKALAEFGPKGPMFTARGGLCGVTRRPFAKPFLIAVNGLALGGGTEMVLAADCVVADDRATFALVEVKRGMIAGGGGAIRMAKRVPRAIALEMVMSGEPISAQRAYEVGLINRVTPDGGALNGALELAGVIAEASPSAVQLSKRLLLESLDVDEERAWELNMATAKENLRTADCKEGQRAFIEKRSPVWSGAEVSALDSNRNPS